MPYREVNKEKRLCPGGSVARVRMDGSWVWACYDAKGQQIFGIPVYPRTRADAEAKVKEHADRLAEYRPTLYRLESMPKGEYKPRGDGSQGWTRRDEFGIFDTLDSAQACAFGLTNNGSGHVFAVIPLSDTEAEEWRALVAKLTACLMTADAEGRMCDLMASGPLRTREIDAELVALGLAEIVDDEEKNVLGDHTEPTTMAFRWFYDETGGVRPIFRWVPKQP